MHQVHPASSPSFPLSQRELVRMALQRGCRAAVAPAAPQSQRDLVRQALALGFGGAPKGPQRGARPGIHR